VRTSVVLCTRNRVEETIRFCKSLFVQTEPTEELVIVDSSDMPMDKNREFMAFLLQNAGATSINYVHSDPGLTKQRNIGVAASHGDIIYFFDDDIILEPNFLQIMNNSFRRHPDYMGGMGEMKDLARPGLSTIERFLRAADNIYGYLFLLTLDNGDGKFHKSGLPRYPHGTTGFREVEDLNGGLTGYRRVVFDEFQFDERLTGYSYMEDVDFSRRVSYKYRLFYNPEAKVEHRVGAGGRGERRRNREMFILNHQYLFYKNFYPRNRLYAICHYWSILGLFFHSLLLARFDELRGYLEGLGEFRKKRKELLGSE